MSSKQLFYKFDITSQIFYKTRFSAAFVNLKPIVPGRTYSKLNLEKTYRLNMET